VWYWYFMRTWKTVAYWLFSGLGVMLVVGGIIVAVWADRPDRWTMALRMWLLGALFWFGIRFSYRIGARLGL